MSFEEHVTDEAMHNTLFLESIAIERRVHRLVMSALAAKDEVRQDIYSFIAQWAAKEDWQLILEEDSRLATNPDDRVKQSNEKKTVQEDLCWDLCKPFPLPTTSLVFRVTAEADEEMQRKQTDSAIRIQTWWKMVFTSRAYHDVVKELRFAAEMTQKCGRGWWTRKQVAEMRAI